MANNKTAKTLTIVLVIVIIGGIFVYKQMGRIKNSGDAGGKYPLEIEKIDMQTVTGYGLPTIIDASADNCPPCKKMAPDIKALHKEYDGKAVIQTINVSKHGDGIKDWPVQVTPALFFFNADGTPYVPSKDMLSRISFSKYNNKATGEHIFTTHEGSLTKSELKDVLKDMGVK